MPQLRTHFLLPLGVGGLYTEKESKLSYRIQQTFQNMPHILLAALLPATGFHIYLILVDRVKMLYQNRALEIQATNTSGTRFSWLACEASVSTMNWLKMLLPAGF